MPKPKTSKKEDNVDVVEIQKFLKQESKDTGRTEKELLKEMFSGFTLYIQETSEKDGELLTVWKPSTVGDNISAIDDLRKLRNFEPIARCIEYIKSVILGGAIDIGIDDPEDKEKKKIKADLKEWIRTVHQDEYTASLYTLLSILLDEALTVGDAGAFINYQIPVNFAAFAKDPKNVSITVKEGNDNKSISYPIYELTEPKWEDLSSITQLKIFKESVKRLKLYRNPETWEANYWTLDEVTPSQNYDIEQLSGYRKATGGKTQVTQKYLPWQIFWLVVNRLDWSEKGKSVIEPVAEIARILDRILNAVGEGLYRAGNKKYFIVCGTEKRPWSKPYIRNTMQQIKEMGKKNWTTVPVPAGFDIKEIGGQVFEAVEVVNYFLSLIAQGMHVPLEVIGDRYARGDQEKAYTACHDEIERMKYEFKNAVEMQLLRREVWCEHGKVKTKQGGSTTVVYIPELKITSRGLFSPNDRLEKIFKALNVANPINPLVKLEMEKDMAKIFGYDEVKLETQDEAKKALKEAEELMKKNLELKAKGGLNPLGEKSQGPQKPQSLQQQDKRLEGGVSRTNRGQAKMAGGSRVTSEQKMMTAQEVEENLEEVQELPHQVVDINVNVKTEAQKVEVTTKTEPQIIKMEPVESQVTIKIDPKELNEQFTKALDEQKNIDKRLGDLGEKLVQETRESRKKSLETRIEKLRSEKLELDSKVELMKAQKVQIEQESQQKTEEHDEKMKALKKVNEDLNEE